MSKPGMAVTETARTTEVVVSPSVCRVSLSKKRRKKCWTSRRVMGVCSGMGGLHDVDDLLGDDFGVGLLDELGEDALEGWQVHELGELAGRGVGDNLAAGEHDNPVADELHSFEDVRDVEDGFALAGEEKEEVFEEAGGDGVEAGEGLVEDDEAGVVEKGGGN